MSMKLISFISKKFKRLASIILVNISLLIAGIFAVNALVDFRNFASDLSPRIKRDVETELAQFNAAYFNQCLADDHVQAFFPYLLKDPRYQNFAGELDFLPLGSVPRVQTAYCNEGLGFVTYTSDRFGFRNFDENWDRPIDIMLVGDSFVHGACVDDDATFTQLLRHATGLNVVNVATGGNGPDHYARVIDTFVPMLRPNRVILFFYPNDNMVIDALDPYLQNSGIANTGYSALGVSSEANPFFARVLPRLAITRENNIEITSCDRVDLSRPDLVARIVADYEELSVDGQPSTFSLWLQNRVSELIRLRALRLSLQELLNVDENSHLASPNVTAAAIDALFEACTGFCRPSIVLLEQSEYWRPDPRIDSFYAFIEEQAEILAGETDYDLIDIRGVIDPERLDHFAPLGPHYSPRGYRTAADAIASTLLRQGADN